MLLEQAAQHYQGLGWTVSRDALIGTFANQGFARVIGDNAVVNLEAHQRQSQREQIENQGRQVDYAGNPGLGDDAPGVGTSRRNEQRRGARQGPSAL